MDFPEALSEKDLKLRIKEWQIAGFLVAGYVVGIDGRETERVEYEDGQDYWRILAMEEDGEGVVSYYLASTGLWKRSQLYRGRGWTSQTG